TTSTWPPTGSSASTRTGACTLRRPSTPSPPRTILDRFSRGSMFFESFDGTRLSYEDYAEGEPIVFVAGVMLAADMWDSQIPYFVERGYRCIPLDRRGTGRSDRPTSGYDPDSFAYDLAALLRHIGVEGATLVGNSLGSV